MKLKNNNNILCTISAGYSSAIMAIKIREWYPNHNIIFLFANTGREHIESLKFLNKIDIKYNIGVVYLEAIINQNKQKGTNYKVVNFEDLDTTGKNFEDGIKKYGVPNVANKWCTRELKLTVMDKYANDIFGRNNYSIALGIRYDEIDRISKHYKTNNLFYPLFDNKITKKERNKFWHNSDIQINIPAFKGNCKDCFEKSFRKIFTIYTEDPNESYWSNLMEKKYSKLLIDGKPQYNELIEKYGGVYFNRGNISIEEIIEMAKQPFSKATDEYIYENDLFDFEEECGSKCEIFK